MTLILTVGDQPVVLGDTAEYPNPAFASDPTQPEFLPDPDAQLSWEDSAASGAVALTDNGTVDGTGTVSVAPIAPGLATIVDFATDPDGHKIGPGVAFDVQVNALASTDATQLAGISVVSNPNPGAAAPSTPTPAAGNGPAPIPVPAS